MLLGPVYRPFTILVPTLVSTLTAVSEKSIRPPRVPHPGPDHRRTLIGTVNNGTFSGPRWSLNVFKVMTEGRKT